MQKEKISEYKSRNVRLLFTLNLDQKNHVPRTFLPRSVYSIDYIFFFCVCVYCKIIILHIYL